MFRFFLSLILMLPLSASARVCIYLIPEVEAYNRSLTLSDIASIEGDPAGQAGVLKIPQSLYKDFIVDRSELNDYLSMSLNQTFTIFGNGAKLSFKSNIPDESPVVIKDDKPFIVKKGENVDLVIRKKGISIEMSGKSLQNGTEDDEISVRLKNGKILKGKPLGAGRVAVHL